MEKLTKCYCERSNCPHFKLNISSRSPFGCMAWWNLNQLTPKIKFHYELDQPKWCPLRKENIKSKIRHYTTFPITRYGGNNSVKGIVEEIQAPITEKVWGSEDLIHNKDHCVKIMKLKPGYEVSNHLHFKKQESFILISGTLIIETIDQSGQVTKTILSNPLESFTLDAGVPHTFYTPDGQVEETVFVEASTHDESDDSYRIRPSQKRENPSSR